MTTFWLVLFVVGVAWLLLRMFLDWAESKPMPFSCPKCGYGGDEDMAGQPRTWWAAERGERVRCRYCLTAFKEHPNGLLAEDREA